MVDRTTRIMNEFNKLKNSKCISIIKCEFMNGDINNWKVAFDGSPCSPYGDGIFQVKINLPDNFPKGRPFLYFITKMFHPNIRQSDGLVSLNLMYDWIESRTIEEVLFGFIEVMDNPRVGTGYGEEPQKLLAQDRDKFFEKVEEYTYKYAMDDV
jgi:ubiquitin-protein ligase